MSDDITGATSVILWDKTVEGVVMEGAATETMDVGSVSIDVVLSTIFLLPALGEIESWTVLAVEVVVEVVDEVVVVVVVVVDEVDEILLA